MTGPEFRAIREALGLTQSQLGDRLNLNRKTVYYIESAPVVEPLPALAIRQLQADAKRATV